MKRIGGFLLIATAIATIYWWWNQPTNELKAVVTAALQKRGPALASKTPTEALADKAITRATQNLGTAPAHDDEQIYTPRVKEALDLAAKLDQTRDAALVDAQIDKIIKELTLADAVQLQEIAEASTRTHNARYLAVFMLSERPEVFAHQLEDIGRSESEALNTKAEPHTLAETERHFEEGLRFQALASLDKLNAKGPREQKYFSDLKQSTTNPFIRKLAGMGSVGAGQGRSLIDEYKNVKR
jgi:hypothetical protein